MAALWGLYIDGMPRVKTALCALDQLLVQASPRLARAGVPAQQFSGYAAKRSLIRAM